MYTSGKREKRKNIQTETQCTYSTVYINMYLTATCKQIIKWVVNFGYYVFKKIFFLFQDTWNNKPCKGQ